MFTVNHAGNRKYEVVNESDGFIVTVTNFDRDMCNMTKREASSAASYLNLKSESGQVKVGDQGNVTLSF